MKKRTTGCVKHRETYNIPSRDKKKKKNTKKKGSSRGSDGGNTRTQKSQKVGVTRETKKKIHCPGGILITLYSERKTDLRETVRQRSAGREDMPRRSRKIQTSLTAGGRKDHGTHGWREQRGSKWTQSKS